MLKCAVVMPQPSTEKMGKCTFTTAKNKLMSEKNVSYLKDLPYKLKSYLAFGLHSLYEKNPLTVSTYM